MSDKLTERDLLVLATLRALGGTAAPHLIGSKLYGPAGRPDAKVRPTLDRLRRLGKVRRSSWLNQHREEWTLVEESTPRPARM